MRILISAPSLDVKRNVSGVSSVVRELRRTLGDQIEFRHLEVGSEQIGGSVRRQVKSLAKLVPALSQIIWGEYDAFHSNTALNPKSVLRDMLLIVAARARRRPVVLHLHGGRFLHDRSNRLMNAGASMLFRMSARIVTLSGSERRQLAAQFPRYAVKMRFVLNGVDLARAHATQREAGGTRTLNVVFAGRFVVDKGLRTVLRVARWLSDIQFAFFGDGPLRDEVATAAASSSAITFGGIYAPEESIEVLARFDVILLPSLSGEGMPMVIAEAMAVGVIPVCTPIASLPEMIADGVNGFLVRPGSSEAVAAVLTHLRDRPDERRRISANARAFAESHFDATRNFLAMADIYWDVVQTTRPRSRSL